MRSGLVLAAAFVLAGCGRKPDCPTTPTAAPATRSATSSDPAGVTDVLRAVEQWRKAYEMRSADGLAEAYDHGKEMTLVQQDQVIVGWDAVREDIARRLSDAKEVRLRLTDMRVALFSGGAVVTAAATREVSTGITTITDNGVLSLTFGRDGERWVIVSEHYSVKLK